MPRTFILRRELGHSYNVYGVAMGVVDGQPVIVSVARDDVSLWDARTGAPRGEPRRGHDGAVMSVAVGVIDSQPVVAPAGSTPPCASGAPARMVLPILSSVTSVAIVEGGPAIGTCSSVLFVTTSRSADPAAGDGHGLDAECL